MSVTGLTPYDLAQLIAGPCRLLISKTPNETFVPANFRDLLDTTQNVDGSYPAASKLLDLGATTDGGAYSQQISTQGYQIDQATGDVAVTVTDVIRSLSCTLAQLSPEILRIIEQAPEVKEIEKGAGWVKEKQIAFGTIGSLEHYTVAIIGRRLKGQGADVTEPGGVVRGAMVAAVLYNAQITGDQRTIQVARGSLASAPLGFQGYPMSGQPEGKEFGKWMFEQTGAIEGGS